LPILPVPVEGSISSIITTCPLSLDIDNPDAIEAGNYYLPFSTGFEIECIYSPEYNESNFKNIPYIMDVINDGGEQRYRIPSGIKGLHCLYNISLQLKFNSIKTQSGIHYHIDCTDNQDLLNYNVLNNYKELIFNELNTWEYKGTYNRKDIGPGGSWCRIQPYFKTIEFRIGEMTFDYSLLFKRINHLNRLIQHIANFEILKNSPLLKYEEEDIKTVLTKRIHKI